MAAKKQSLSYNFPSPSENTELVGHTATMRSFRDAWEMRDKYPIHPVWILSGVKGIGKATLAYKIARDVYGNVGDFFIIDMPHNIDKDRRPKPDGSQISVYTVREMIERMQLSSMSGEWRVIIIDSVDELNQAASNAILKLLEEPPAKTLFLLIAHKLNNVLPTIRSRARVEKMAPLTDSQLRELFYKFIPNEDLPPALLKLAAGSFGRIAALKQSGADGFYEQLLEICRKSNASDIMRLASALAKQPDCWGILSDAAAHFGLAELYPEISRRLRETSDVHLEPEIALFSIITDIKKCL